jgi:hypothetical protein
MSASLARTDNEPACAKKAPRREGRRGAKQRAWAGGQIKRAEQLKHGCPYLVPPQTHFSQKILRAMTRSVPWPAGRHRRRPGRLCRKVLTCAAAAPARGGPNLFATKLSDQRFPEALIQGRKGTQMPAFGLRCRRRLDRKRPGVRQFCGGNERPDGWFLPLSAVKLNLILQGSTEFAADSIRARKESRRAPILWRTQRS